VRRGAATIGAGFTVSAAAALLLPPLGHAGLHATVVLAPLVGSLLAAQRRALGAPPPAGTEWLLAAAWVALALASPRLGLPGVEPLLFVAFALLVARRILALAPALHRRMARGRTAALAALAFTGGLALLPWVGAVAPPDGDEPYYLLLAESLVRDGDLDLRNQYAAEAWRRFGERRIGPQPGDPKGASGEQYSRHDSLLVVLIAPFWAAAGTFGARLAIVALWALLVERLVRVALAFGVGRRGALRAALAAGFTAPLLVYAHAIWVEVSAALAVALILERLAKGGAAGRSGPRRDLLVVAGALVALPLLKLRLLVVALPLALLALVRRALPRRAALVGVGVAAAAGALVLGRNAHLVGRALRVTDWRTLVATDLEAPTFALRLGGLLFDVAFGLCAAGPLWLLALPGAVALARRQREARWAFAAFAPYLLLVVWVAEWYGAWGPPFRFGIVLVPWLAAALAAQLDRPPNWSASLLRATLGWTSGIIALLFVVEPGWATSFADGRSRLVDLAAAPFAADFARFLPSMIRPRTATWAMPLALVALVTLCCVGRARRRVAADGVAAALPLALACVWILSAHRTPTRTVELEDPWVAKRGGTLEPELFRPGRVFFTGAWRLPAGAAASVRPVAGGERLDLTVRFRAAPGGSGTELELLRDGEPQARWAPDPRAGWVRESLRGLDWPRGADLELRVRCPGLERCGAVDVDRIDLRWQR
jgi:hypothetical protein